jgi:hypothetical protein
MRGAFIDPSLRLGFIPAGHGHNLAIAGQCNRLPVFHPDPSGTQETPTTFFLAHNKSKSAATLPVRGGFGKRFG